MGLPALLSSSDRTPSNRSKSSRGTVEADIPPEFIYDEAQLPCIPPERPDLRELNGCLEALAAAFPDIQIEVFRELLSGFDGESRLALAADALLKNRVTWVKGRWKVADKQAASTTNTSEGAVGAERLWSTEYKKAVQALAWQEFKGLSKSTINAVLAESNYSYLEARKTLVTLSSKSWRFTISSIFMRRKPVAADDSDNHPLVRWRSTGQGSIIPTIRSTGSAELDRELYEALIHPIKERQRVERETQDRELAVQLNNEEAEETGAVHECACCFTTGAFEEFTHCNRDAHMICFRCVQHSIKEALFGQGWLSSIIPETGTLRCMAVDRDECPGFISSEHLHRAMMEEKKGAEMLRRLDQRLAEHSLLASGVPLIHCPFCSYAEIDDIYMPAHESHLRIRLAGVSSLLLVLFCATSVLLTLPLALVSSILCLLFTSRQSTRARMSTEWSHAMNRHRRRRRGLQFSCQNPQCKRVSCLSCSKAWTDIHVCNESSLVALRTQVEQAMSMAIKRVCPRCNTSFVKNAGCNKLTCPCGYKMCYVCRADLSDEGYRHFCDHFRPDGDPRPCTECDRCNLWESEDTDRVLQEAREEAERKWKALENRDLSTQEKAFLETGIASRGAGMSVERMLSTGRLPSWPEIFDIIVETIFA
ncbi:E3 ubiquitin-protein ligase [Cladobotryum mycophilum]|uniref:E3 ubiquitin-protein ligase n=1 Tax=Cladobotryum mycophilum TaxID=491253 RepID=A0ABR0T1Y0_9HYPO